MVTSHSWIVCWRQPVFYSVRCAYRFLIGYLNCLPLHNNEQEFPGSETPNTNIMRISNTEASIVKVQIDSLTPFSSIISYLLRFDSPLRRFKYEEQHDFGFLNKIWTSFHSSSNQMFRGIKTMIKQKFHTKSKVG